jgi:polysaccharide biosynthesis/export protein
MMSSNICTKVSYSSFVIFFFVIFFTSCITSKEIKYLQDKNNSTDTVKVFTKKSAYLVQPGDYLDIKFSSMDPEINAYINLINPTSYINQGLYSGNKFYIVNDSGYIELPQTGKLYVKDISTQNIKTLIESKINYKNVIVTVLLSGFTITVLGEVNRPGRITLDKEKVNIFELIGLCGDLTIYADRKNIKLIRETHLGPKIYIIDLTDKNILFSDYYYVQPYDFIYVEPLRVTFFESTKFPFISTVSIILSTTMSILFLLNYFK